MKYKFLSIIFIFFIFSGCGSLLTRENVTDARSDLVDGDYSSALASIELMEDEIPDLSDNQKAEVYLIKAKILHGLERDEEAKDYFNRIMKKFPKTHFSAQAKALMKKLYH